MARIFGDRFHLDLAAVFLVDKNTKTHVMSTKTLENTEGEIKKGQSRENIFLTMSVPGGCFGGAWCPLNWIYTFYLQNVTKLHIY